MARNWSEYSLNGMKVCMFKPHIGKPIGGNTDKSRLTMEERHISTSISNYFTNAYTLQIALNDLKGKSLKLVKKEK